MSQPRYSYQECIDNSEKVAWKVKDVVGDGTFDLGRRFMPEGLAQVNAIEWLTPAERLKLNQLRGLTYAHIFAFVEEFILRKAQQLAAGYGPDQPVARRALARFAEEEIKHQELFEATKAALTQQLGECELIGGAVDVAGAVLSKSELGVMLLFVLLEWLTQQHYTEVFRSAEERESLDPAFVRLFKAHWLEEAQHAKLDTLELVRAAGQASPAERARAVDEVLELGGAFDGVFQTQVALDVKSLERLCKRTFTEAERKEITEKQLRAYRFTFLVGGLNHPNVLETVKAYVDPAGVEKFRAAATALSA